MKGTDLDRGEIVLYRTEDGKTALDVRLEAETVWLTQAQLVELFQRSQPVISRHMSNIFKEKEWDPKSNMQKMHSANSDKPVLCGLVLLIVVVVAACAGPADVPRQSAATLYQPSQHEVFIRFAGDNNPEGVTAMLDEGMDPNVRRSNGETALQAAVSAGRVETVRILIAAGADVQVRDEQGTLFHYAADDESIPIIEMLLSAGVNVNDANDYGTTPLMYAAHSGQTRAVEFLVKSGADVNWKNPVSGMTPLMDAIRMGHPQAAEVLLRHGADTEAAVMGQTPLMHAARFGFSDVVSVLLRAGADVNAKGVDGERAVTLAAREGHTKVVELLRAAGARE